MFAKKLRFDDDLEEMINMRLDIMYLGNEIRNYDENLNKNEENCHILT